MCAFSTECANTRKGNLPTIDRVRGADSTCSSRKAPTMSTSPRVSGPVLLAAVAAATVGIGLAAAAPAAAITGNGGGNCACKARVDGGRDGGGLVRGGGGRGGFGSGPGDGLRRPGLGGEGGFLDGIQDHFRPDDKVALAAR